MSFYGLEIAKKGLFLSSRALNLTGHNLANVNTQGYTRQRIISESVVPGNMNSRFAPVENGRIGGGAMVSFIEQVRNEYLDREIRQQYADFGKLTAQADTLITIESMFDEVSSASISNTLKLFFNAINEFSTDTASKELRTNIRATGQALTETINHYYQKLSELQRNQNDNIKNTVDTINIYAQNIADYNRQIYAYELGGEPANDLRDKRNIVLDELAKLIDITYQEDSQGKLHVYCGTQELVNHTDPVKLSVHPNITDPVTGDTGFYEIHFGASDTDPVFQYTSGELMSYKHMRDGNSEMEMGIPFIISNLNQLARGIAEEFNKVHETGWTMNHGTVASQTGIPLFWVDKSTGVADYSFVTAKTLRISDEVMADVYMIAGSTEEVDVTANPQKGNNKLALKLVELCTSIDVPNLGSFEGYLKNLNVAIGVESGKVQTMAASQTSVITSLENRRESYSGVSMDEEVTLMLQYQHMYAANSRMVNAIDEALDILINRTGLVGRA